MKAAEVSVGAPANGDEHRLLFVADLQHVLRGLGEDAIYGLLRSGGIKGREVAGRWVTTPEAVQDWLNSITNGTDEPEVSDTLEVDRWRRS